MLARNLYEVAQLHFHITVSYNDYYRRSGEKMLTLFTKQIVLCQFELQFSKEEIVPWMNHMKLATLLLYY